MTRPSITWRLVFAYIILLIGIIAIALFSSCGTRKKIVDTDIHNEKQTDKSITEGNVKKDSEAKEQSSTKEHNAITDERQEQRITELFNENGSLKSRITELLNRKTVDNSTKEINSLKSTVTRLDSVITTKIFRQMIIQDKKVHSDLNRDSTVITNLGKWGIVVGLLISGIVIWLIKRNK